MDYPYTRKEDKKSECVIPEYQKTEPELPTPDYLLPEWILTLKNYFRKTYSA